MKNLIYLLVILPLIILIHELGHAFFVKIFGGKVTKISLGLLGKRIFSIGFFEINLWYFTGGLTMYSDLKLNNKLTSIITLLGGIIFNIISIVIINILGYVYYPQYMYTMSYTSVCIYMRAFVSFSIFIVILNILPVKILNINTDGRQIYQLIRYGKSKLFND